MTVRDELHRLVDLLTDEDAAEALEYMRWLSAEEDALSQEEIERLPAGEEEIAQGNYITLAELTRSLDT